MVALEDLRELFFHRIAAWPREAGEDDPGPSIQRHSETKMSRRAVSLWTKATLFLERRTALLMDRGRSAEPVE